ncbi:MAG: type II toxin-antitoxin system VapC family toxin [Chthoniobacterales bacterium]
MKRAFLDASILVEACLLNSAKFSEADALIKRPNVTSAHALAEAYATLSGDKRLGIRPHDASVMVEDCAERLTVGEIGATALRKLISSAPARGIVGGLFYDAIHAEVARAAGCTVIRTLNVTHFRHVAPDLEVQGL